MRTGANRAAAEAWRRRWRLVGATPAAIAIAIVLTLRLVTGHASTQDDGLSPQERRGKDIYFGLTGSSSVSPSTITARVGDRPIELAGSMMACANCHGSDGRGRPEGVVVPSDITWEALTKPYGVTHPSGRRHPPYTERLLVRAIGLGIDPAGNALQAAMPRFQMSHADVDALIHYLKRLSTDNPSGISDAVIRVGTIVSVTGPLADAGRAVSAALSAYFETLNAQGGIYGRKIELRPISPDIDSSLRETAPFAMVAGLLADTDTETIASIEAHGVPFVGPLTMFPQQSTAGRTFYLLSGAEQQACALLDFRAQTERSLAIVHARQTVPAAVVDRIRAHGERAGVGLRNVSVDRDGTSARAIADQLKQSGAAQVLMLVSGTRVLEIATELAAIDWTPALLVPGSLATNDLLQLPQPFRDRTFLALPSVPSDLTPAALAEYRTLAETYRLPSTDVAWQLAAIGSAKVLTQGLKLAGRGVTRATFVSALEGLSDFDTGLMPRIRFGRGRRHGAPGAYIVTLDSTRKSFKQLTGWRPVSDAMD